MQISKIVQGQLSRFHFSRDSKGSPWPRGEFCAVSLQPRKRATTRRLVGREFTKYIQQSHWRLCRAWKLPNLCHKELTRSKKYL